MNPEKRTSKRINIIVSILLITFSMGFFAGIVFHVGRPYEIPYGDNDLFGDFFSTLRVAKEPYNSVGFGRGYFPFIYVFISIFEIFKSKSLYIALSLFFSVFYITSYIFLEKRIERLSSCFVLCSFSYPLIFLIDRGNVEMFIYIFIALFMLVYFEYNTRLGGGVSFALAKDILSALFLSFAIASKLYPAVFIILMLRDKRYRCLIFTLLFSSLFTFFCFILVNGSLTGILSNLKWFNDHYSFAPYPFSWISQKFAHSIFDLIKSLSLLFSNGNVEISYNFSRFATGYAIVIFLIFIVISAYIVFFKESNWRSVFLLTSAMIFFPYSSHDYTLLHLLFPMFMFITSDENNGKLDLIFSILFVLPLCQLHWLDLIDDFNWSIGIFFRPMCVITIMLIIIIQGLLNQRQECLP